MTPGTTARDLLRELQPDAWREAHPFLDDVQEASKVILHPYAGDAEKSEALRLWLQANQPCLFGRVAAGMNRIHVCVLSDDDLVSSDKHMRDKIKRERLLWKIGSLRNERPEHGFMLLVASQRVALAAPDQNLLRFAHHIRDLAWEETELDEYGNDLTWETLYLRNPSDKTYVKFTFSVDYFGAQGDGRWWHDHRVPGGIAFTANSVGHMALTREWYEGKGPQTEWIVKVAMETVDLGADTAWGKAIWLEGLEEGRPSRGEGCPFRDVASLKDSLKDKDWSYYAGYLSTDHSIREEFFHERPERPSEIRSRWLLDLLYLYDPSARDYRKFVLGEPVLETAVFQEVGTPDTWRAGPILSTVRKVHRKAIAPIVGVLRGGIRRIAGSTHEDSERAEIIAALDSMRQKWSTQEWGP